MTRHQPGSDNRDLRLDLFRGLANWAIFLDHVPNNVAAWITTKHYGFSDAAELFVFVSGYTVAFVYSRAMRARGFVSAAIALLGRVWQIYVAYILLFVFYVVAIGYVAQRYGHAHLLDEFNIRRLIADPVEFLKHGLLLEYKPLNLDVLPLYIVLMVVFPPVLWLLTRIPNIALVGSIILYFAARTFGWNLPAYPDGVWYFNPLAWQLLFMIGAWAAMGGAAAGGRILYSRPVLMLAALYVVFAAAIALVTRAGSSDLIPEAIRTVLLPNDKTNLAPYRVIHFLALALIVSWLIPRNAPGLSAPLWRPVLACGQKSLEVFCTGVFLAFVAHFLIELVSDTPAFQIAVSMAGIATMTAVAYFRIWTKERRSISGGRSGDERQTRVNGV